MNSFFLSVKCLLLWYSLCMLYTYWMVSDLICHLPAPTLQRWILRKHFEEKCVDPTTFDEFLDAVMIFDCSWWHMFLYLIVWYGNKYVVLWRLSFFFGLYGTDRFFPVSPLGHMGKFILFLQVCVYSYVHDLIKSCRFI